MADCFTTLARILTLPLVSIDILPGYGHEWVDADADASLAPFLLKDGNLGIPQKALVQAYFVAIESFKFARKRISIDQFAVEDAVSSSSVIVLTNPAHTTALDVRKALVKRKVLDAKKELEFTTALLTIRESSKQSIMWHHRRWLLRYIFTGDVTVADGDLTDVHFPPDLFRREYRLVSADCELYDRNYYAWAHRSICSRALVAAISSSTSKDEASQYMSVLEDEVNGMRTWIEQHVSDYSAVQYFHNLHDYLRQLPFSMIETVLPLISGTNSMLSHAFPLLRRYADHESLWLYLRSGISFVRDGDEWPREEIQQFAQMCASSSGPLEGKSIAFANDPNKIGRNARLFLLWLTRHTGHES
ncbi:hypothetical protein JAAARDRAFT_195970 [Jaapia argillacea MUCL 33604]|uniref:Protein prenyltransferase n=1 Tax=Jaapia argillacea MUCL 33604 TaxID=933084 RepID=A0A067PJW9_9AGAM|nr:hypothetical protein JAAARDRAFT_195970 [Jaapia argillacea MUCL 33604]